MEVAGFLNKNWMKKGGEGSEGIGEEKRWPTSKHEGLKERVGVRTSPTSCGPLGDSGIYALVLPSSTIWAPPRAHSLSWSSLEHEPLPGGLCLVGLHQSLQCLFPTPRQPREEPFSSNPLAQGHLGHPRLFRLEQDYCCGELGSSTIIGVSSSSCSVEERTNSTSSCEGVDCLLTY